MVCVSVANYKETAVLLIHWHVTIDLARPGIDAAVEIDQAGICLTLWMRMKFPEMIKLMISRETVIPL